MNKNTYSLKWLNSRIEFVNLVLDLYYKEKLTQVEISKKLFVSQCVVSFVINNNIGGK